MNAAKDLMRDERGLETIEYAIITGVVVAGIIAAITVMGVWLSQRFVDPSSAVGA